MDLYKNRLLFAIVTIFISHFLTQAQENFPTNGVADYRAGVYLLNDATIIKDADSEPFVGDILIKSGKIVKIASSIEEKGAVVIDVKGKYLYPSFIDLYAQYGIENAKPNIDVDQRYVSNKSGAYNWNEAIKSEFRAHEEFVANTKEAKEWRNAGFGAVLTLRKDGIARGSGAFVALADLNEHEVIIKDVASNNLSLSKGSSSQSYPSSQMGAIALLRQTYYDGKWYAKNHNDYNISLENWNQLQNLPTIVDPRSMLGMLRVDKIGDEFGKQYIIKGTGEEYQKLDAIKATNAFLIVPVEYPSAYDAEDPWDAEFITLSKMKHWELAPYNLKFLADKNVPFAITSDGLKNKSDLLKNVRIAIEKGLSEKTAFKALTINPAKQIGVENYVGTLEIGKLANILVTDKPIFEKDAIILQNWVKGVPYQINPFKTENIDGAYSFQIGKYQFNATLSNSDSKPKLLLHLNDTTDIEANYSSDAIQATISFAIPEGLDNSGYTTLSGWKNKNEFKGIARLPNGRKVNWSATKSNSLLEDNENNVLETEELVQNDENTKDEIGSVIYPFTAYGNTTLPKAETVIFKNATVWTNEKEGILEHSDVLISDGKIVKIGKDINAKDAIVVDASGKHLTAGIIDEHSHIAISGGVNEWAKISSAEVRIGDVINSEDVNIYRQLAGGVVAVQLLHGSANPIGGQSALIKLRWGKLPEEMKIKGADGYIKFALGENVKQANWEGDRFPQTRMGVEQVFVDYFTRAKEYADNKDVNKRIDIELETLAEILNKERFITCHSYVQSEINMLMKVAERFNFKVNTFTHILEGYKIADKMKEHGVGASTFADWWAYKFEVKDAIPYNAAILNEMGIVTALNSDDAEMGRRLNQEAAKVVKFGNVSEEDAWKMVTLNPAKLLHLDDKMGSIKVGKSADLVLWTENPLSIYTKAAQTYVDGVKYFDMDEDKKMREWIEKERARLIQKMLLEKKGGATVVKPTPTEEHHYHCDDVENWGFEE